MRKPLASPDENSIWGRYFSADPFCWALWLLISRAFRHARNKLLAIFFHAPGIDLGEGFRVKGAKHIIFGRNFYANRYLWLEAITTYKEQRFDSRIVFGNNVSLSDSVHITCIEHIAIRDNVLIGSKVFISDHHHGVYRGERQSHPDQPPALRLLGGGGAIEIGENVWIGDNVVIVGPVVIGNGAVIGANSVVTRNVEPKTIVVGTPAEVIKSFNSRTKCWERK